VLNLSSDFHQGCFGSAPRSNTTAQKKHRDLDGVEGGSPSRHTANAWIDSPMTIYSPTSAALIYSEVVKASRSDLGLDEPFFMFHWITKMRNHINVNSHY
jgi:hypothetical protein